MSKIVELYVRELTREGSTMAINDVPKKLRKQVEDAIAAIEAAANACTSISSTWATSTTSRSKPNNKEGRVLRPSGFYEVTQ